MNARAIDYITEDFYELLSFMDGEMPDLETTGSLFLPDAMLINNSLGKPLKYTPEAFITSVETQIEDGTLLQFMQRELYSKTEVFGKIAQRLSVYEYSFVYHEIDNLPKGINYIQFIQVDDSWLINSMVWCDENENFKVPAEYLG